MEINIVTVKSGWILQKISERIASNNKCEDSVIKVSHVPNPLADVNYYVDLQNCYFRKSITCDVAYFTHAHENSEVWLRNLMLERNAFQLDGIVSMNKRYTNMLEKIGYPKNRLKTIVPGQTYDMFPLKKIKLGIVSRGGFPGLGQEFLENFIQQYDLTHFQIKILGSGWDSIIPIANRCGVDLTINSDEDYSSYPKFYEDIDYLLIVCRWTAGPMSMQESLSCGIPIIASDVGFVGYEFNADYVYAPNDNEGLSRILNSILKVRFDKKTS